MVSDEESKHFDHVNRNVFLLVSWREKREREIRERQGVFEIVSFHAYCVMSTFIKGGSLSKYLLL